MSMATQEQRHAEVAVYSLQSAETCLQQKNYGRAFAHYLLVLKLQPSRKAEIKECFTLALREWGEQLEQAGRLQDMFSCYQQAFQLFPECEGILNNMMGGHLFRLGYADEAAGCFRKALRLCPDLTAARHNLDNLRGHLVERWHFIMLNDKRRNQAYQQAIQKAVEQGHDVVLDIGSGTGLLSIFAAQAGARHVYGCEMSKAMYQLSHDIVRANHTDGGLQLIHCKSTDLKIPDTIPARVSMVVTETFDAGLLGEHILSTLSHAWKQLLNNREGTKARVIPGGASIYITAIESKSIRRQNRFWYPGLRYLDLSDVELRCTTSATSHPEEFPPSQSSSAAGTNCLPDLLPDDTEAYEPYTCERLANIPGGYRLLSDTRVAMNINFNDAEMIDSYLHGHHQELTLQVTEPGRLDALAVWFDLHLDDDLTLTTDPKADSCWEQALFPVHIEGQQYVGVGDQLQIHCKCQQDRLGMTCMGITRRRHRTCSNSSAPSSCQQQNLDSAMATEHGFVFTTGGAVGRLNSTPHCESPIQFGDCDFFGMQDPFQYRGVSFLCGQSQVNASLAPASIFPTPASTDPVLGCTVQNLSDSIESHVEEQVLEPGTLQPAAEAKEEWGALVEHSTHNDASGQWPVSEVMPHGNGSLQCTTESLNAVEYIDAPISNGHDSIQDPSAGNSISGPGTDNANGVANQFMQDNLPTVVHDTSGTTNRQQQVEKQSDLIFMCPAKEEASCDLSLPTSAGSSSANCDYGMQAVGAMKPCVFHLDRREIERLNDLEWSDSYCAAIRAIQAERSGALTVLDIMEDASLLPVQIAKMVAGKVGVAHSSPVVERLLQHLATANEIEEDRLQFGVECVQDAQSQWDVLITELVEPCGILRQHILEELALARVTYMKPGGVILPRAARVSGILIESPLLHRESCLLHDENTLGLKVADYINEFQMMTHVDIDLGSLKYKKLSEPFELFSFDFNVAAYSEIPAFLDQACQQRITACNLGRVTAVVYWFELDLAEGVKLCTLNQTHHWRQAAIMQSHHMEVSTGSEILVTAACKNSCLDVTLKLI